MLILACKTSKYHHHLHNDHNSFTKSYHNHYQNNIHWHHHILNVKTALLMCYHIFLKGFLSSVCLLNKNSENYHNYYHYWHYYHLNCHNNHQNINNYVQINIHMKIPVPFKVSKQKIIAIYCPFSPQFCRMKFVKKNQGSQNMQILRQLIIFPYT